MINVLFSALPERWDFYRGALAESFAKIGLEVNLQREFADPTEVDYLIFAANGPVSDFSPYVNAKAVLNLWAGVDQLVSNPTLTMPLTRMVDDGLSEGMQDYVCGHVLRHHLGMDQYICATTTEWAPVVPPLARDRTVGVLGLGALGQTCAQSLSGLNFKTLGWSRGLKTIDGVTCFAGSDGLAEMLAQVEILVLLLPLTPQTKGVLNAETIAQLPEGAVLINPGRGGLIEDEALLEAVEQGHISHATLDVFNVEPLPPEHPYWHSPNVTITPHIASETRAGTAAEIIADNILRGETGREFRFLVDRTTGY